MEKILITAPTGKPKNYCFEKWLLNINQFTYPNFEVVVFDNTPDGGENAEYLNESAAKLPLKFRFWAFPVTSRKAATFTERLCDGHNYCREYALAVKSRHMLHLETDVMPQTDVIERLLGSQKKVIGALYYRDEGRSRKLMAQRLIYRAHDNIVAANFTPADDLCFIDGTVKKIAHVGLGCVMMDTKIFSKIQFRFKKGIDAAPDVYFAEDCKKNGITIYADTSLICSHDNTPWGVFGMDYN